MESLLESSVSNIVDKMFGDKDSKLKAITKIDIMTDGNSDLLTEEEKRTINEIKRINQMEQYYIQRQLHFTLDDKGNLVEINNDEQHDK